VAAKATEKESSYYPVVKNWLDEMLGQLFKDQYHLEITANGNFSATLKLQIPQHRDIIFTFLKEVAPDLTGFVIRSGVFEFIVVEFKDAKLKLDDIYQTRKYAELFDARYALLVSTQEMPVEIIRLSSAIPSLLQIPGYGKLTLVQFPKEGKGATTWIADFPFQKPK
jgi:hypothetical protein